MNFIEAALLIQGSACVYSKKVGPVWVAALALDDSATAFLLRQVAVLILSVIYLASIADSTLIPFHFLLNLGLKWHVWVWV